MMHRVLKAARAIDDHWVGDLLGSVCLFAAAWGGLVIGYGLGL